MLYTTLGMATRYKAVATESRSCYALTTAPAMRLLRMMVAIPTDPICTALTSPTLYGVCTNDVVNRGAGIDIFVPQDQHNNYAVRPRDGAISITDLIGYNEPMSSTASCVYRSAMASLSRRSLIH